MRGSRWLIFAPVAILALLAQPAKADVLGDWTYSQSRDCGGSVEVIDNTITLHGPDNQVEGFGMCGGQANWVKIETTIPADVDTIDFTWTYQTNDGWVYDPPQYGINGVYTLITQQNNVSGLLSVPVIEGDIFTFRQYSTDTCCQPGHLTISNLSLWEFTATTSTTIQETTTSWESITTSTTSTTTTSTIAQSTTVPVTNVPISTIPQTTYTIPVEPTMPDPPATVPLPQIFEPATLETMPLPPEIETFPPETLELPPYIVDTMPFPVDTYPTVEPPDTLPFVGQLPDPPDTMPEPPATLPIELIAELPPELVQALEDAGFTDIPLTEEEFTTAVEAIADLGIEEAIALIEQILATAVTPEQATELASNPDVLAVVTSEQAEEIFATLDVTELDNTQLDALVEAVQSAPTKVRKAFEKTINVFGDGLGNYVPIGSNVPVHTRRTLIAVAAGAATVAAGQRRQK